MATIRGTRRGEEIRSEPGPDTILAGGGDDRIFGSPDDLLIDGGSGDDTLDFSLYRDIEERGVNARLFGGDLGYWPDQDGAQIEINGSIKYVENLVGSIYNDALMGNGFINRIDGNAGDDWVIAFGSGDFLTGGEGQDKFALDYAGKKVTITDFEPGVDRLWFDFAPQISWTRGVGTNAAGVSEEAWIGSYVDRNGNSEKIYLLGVPVTDVPSADWVISFG